MEKWIVRSVMEIEKQVLQEPDATLKQAWEAMPERTRDQIKAVMANIITEQMATPATSAEIIERGISEAVVACHFNAVEKGWWSPGPTFPEALMLVVSELAEALEDFRDGMHPTTQEVTAQEGENFNPYNPKPIGIPSELADAVIRIFDLCGGFKIPLAEAVTDKMAYNRTRSMRHGGKKL